MFEIWCEGDPRFDYTACNLGYGKGRTLIEACDDLATKSAHFSRFFDRKNMSYKGCGIYDSYEKAALSFG